jgi:hypothetical protein
MTPPKGPRRINARLTPELARKVSYLRAETRKSTTEIVCESIDHYYETHARRGASMEAILMRTGFVGCADGPPDLSSSFKDDLTRSLDKKLRRP